MSSLVPFGKIIHEPVAECADFRSLEILWPVYDVEAVPERIIQIEQAYQCA